jgi:hypothetical protein
MASILADRGDASGLAPADRARATHLDDAQEAGFSQRVRLFQRYNSAPYTAAKVFNRCRTTVELRLPVICA